MPALPPGTELDGFRVEEQLHSGGMAVIYRVAEREPGGLPLLMKVPRLGHGEPASSVISFEVEQTVLSALQGPHVPRYVAAGELSQQPYLLMEHVEGKPLSDWVEQGALAVDDVCRLGAAVATALHSVHSQDVIHLDLKPGNIIIRPSGEAVLIDFGLAHHGHYPDLLAEEWNRPIGSAPYIAPEQVLGMRSDPRSDVFALGVILYELATGTLPYGNPRSPAALKKRLWKDPLPPRAENPAFPEWLQEVVLRCLEVRASARYRSAAQLAFDLAHPEHVTVTDRGRRTRRAGWLTVLRRWFHAAGFEPEPCPQPSAYLSDAPIVLVAVATAYDDEPMLKALREAAAKFLSVEGQTRLACVSVIPPAPEVSSSSEEETSTSQQIKHRVLLRHWAEPLQIPPDRVSFHVLESGDAAGALLDYAGQNHVSHIVVGAPPRRMAVGGHFAPVSAGSRGAAASEPLPRLQLMGTVSMKVAAAARCTVTVVRASETG